MRVSRNETHTPMCICVCLCVRQIRNETWDSNPCVSVRLSVPETRPRDRVNNTHTGYVCVRALVAVPNQKGIESLTRAQCVCSVHREREMDERQQE